MRLWLWLLACWWLVGCSAGRPQVVVYCSLDQIDSEPLLRRFEQQTGIQVLAKFDLEATKTTGLVQRIRRESNSPRCDVLWNNEILQTVKLQREGMLQEHISEATRAVPAAYRDPDGKWCGLAARVRVLACSKTLSPVPEASLERLTDPALRGRTGLARPLFGTTLTHFLALRQIWGETRYQSFLESLEENQVAILEGNSVVRDRVAAGQLLLGLCDSDDAHRAELDGLQVVTLPLKADGLLIPNTLALLRGAPHPEAGRRLIDFLLAADSQQYLADGPSAQIPLLSQARVPQPWSDWERWKLPQIDWQAAARDFDTEYERLRRRFLQ
ncbi:MAG: substrate-binding domain-containing protein [Vulcanimicrobiota bacterium]